MAVSRTLSAIVIVILLLKSLKLTLTQKGKLEVCIIPPERVTDLISTSKNLFTLRVKVTPF